MADAIAPIAVAGGTADGAHLHLILGAGRQAVQAHGARVGIKSAGLPRAGRAARHRSVAHFVGLGIVNRRHLDEQLAGVAVVNVQNVRRVQFGLGAVAAHGFKAAGKEFRQIVAAILLHVAGQLPEQANQRVTFVVFVRRGLCAALFLRGDGGGKGRERGLQSSRRNRRRGIGGVAGEALDDGPGGVFKLVVASAAKTKEDAELHGQFLVEG